MAGAAASAAFLAIGDAAIALGASVALATVAATVGVASLAVGTSLALGAVSKALSGKPDSSSLSSGFSGRTQTIKQPIEERRVAYGRTRLGGFLSFASTTINDGLFHMVLTLAGHTFEGIDEYWVNDEQQFLDSNGKPTSGSWNISGNNPRLRIVFGDGTTAGDAAFMAAMQTNLPDVWTSDHRQTGCAKLYVVGATNNFPSGLPNVTVVARCKNDIFDTRTSTAGYTNNAALCIRDYLVDTAMGVGEKSDRIDDTQMNAEANICDESITLAGGGTENRYTINGAFNKGVDDFTVFTRLLSACAGTMTYQGGKYTLYTGAYRTPTIAFGEDEITGRLKVQMKVGRKELFNRIKGTYVNPDAFWQNDSFPAVTNATYLSEDQNEEIWKAGDVHYPFTTSAARAQRLAKIELERVRQQITETLPVNLNGLRVKTGDVINRNYSRLEWVNKPFEIKEWTFANQGGGESPVLGVGMVLRETASTVYDWNSGEETTVDPAPNTNLPNPFVIAKPGVPKITETLFTTRQGGGVKVRATISWAESPGTYIENYLVEYKPANESIWRSLGKVDYRTTSIDFEDIAPGVYDFRISALSDFAQSEYAEVQKEVFGLFADPADITGLSISALSSLAVLSWDPHPDLDVKEGGKIVFRHSNLTSGATWGNSVTIGKAVPGTTNTTVLPLKSGTYLCKAVDSSGIQSVNASLISTKGATLTNFANLSTLAAHTAFTGSQSNTVVTDLKLKLVGGSSIDSWGNIDTITQWDSESGIVPNGTYTMQDGIDLGSVKKTRLGVDITTLTTNVSDIIDSRTTNIDTWESIDGVTGAQTDAEVEVRETDDDPAGSPTWEGWKRLEIADYEARGFQFRVNLETNDPTFNIEVSALTITADEVV